jgi:hypothetical protein
MTWEKSGLKTWLFVLGFIGIMGFSSAQDKGVGVVTFAKGEAQVSRSGQKTVLKIDETVFRDDLIETGMDGKVRIIFDSPELQGMKVVPPNSKLEIGPFLSRKPEEKTLVALSADILAAYARKESEPPVEIGATRGNKTPFIIFPLKATVFGEIPCLLFKPIDGATEFKGTLSFAEGPVVREISFSSADFVVRKDLPPFRPGIKYSLSVQAFKGGEKVAQDARLFSVADPPPAAVAGQLQELERVFQGIDDPTFFLLKGNVLEAGKFPGDAFLAYGEYFKRTGFSPRALRFLQNLTRQIKPNGLVLSETDVRLILEKL